MIDNVYIAVNLPLVPEEMIVARDTNGNAVWHEAVAPAPNPDTTFCGLGS